MIGATIAGDYEVIEEIGQGGVGVVYRCRELQLGRDVALKMLLDPAVTGVDSATWGVKEFIAEGRKLASLNHPNVVHIYKFGNHDEHPYLVMEFLRGRTLREVLDRGGVPFPQAVEIMSQVASGLVAIHHEGLVHRDLSTKNIMIGESGTATILDLGMSKDMNSLSTICGGGQLAGTVLYMSPEQIHGHALTPASDVFAFGVVLYELLSGTHPFAAEHHMAVMYNIANRQHAPLASHLPSAPPSLGDVIDGCLAKESEHRVSLAEARRALQELSRPGDTTLVPHVTRAPASQTYRNPYLNRVMIKRAEEFFGRKRESRRIFARLNATPPGSVSIVGDRKIGKSSLLNHVYMRSNRNRYLEQPDNMVMAFLDLQQEKNMTLAKFAHLLLQMIEYEVRGRTSLSDCTPDLDGIRSMVEHLDQARLTLTIILDEFEVITQNPNFTPEFFSFLRYLANHYNVAYLTSSARDLQELCHTKEVSDSPFFNIFSNMRLGAFEHAEAVDLISVPSARVGYPLAPYCDEIIDMTGLFPFFIQIACSHALEHLEEGPDQRALDLDAVRARYYEEAKLHFRFIWDKSGTDERSALVKIARGKSIPDSYRHLLDDLERRSFVMQDDGEPRLFSSAFEEFVASQSEETSVGFLRRLFGGSRS